MFYVVKSVQWHPAYRRCNQPAVCKQLYQSFEAAKIGVPESPASQLSKMTSNIKVSRGRSIYSYIRISIAKRASRDPRVARPYRTHRLTTISAFFRNRFYELDRWYKARIERPLKVPKCFPLDPDDIQKTLTERLQGTIPTVCT